MKSFEEFYTELTSDDLWFERAAYNHSLTTFSAVANKVYMEYLGTGVFPHIGEARRFVYNKLCKILPDKVKPKPTWNLPKEEKKEEWKPVSWEERAKRLKEFQEMVDQAPMSKPVYKPSSRELIEQGDWRPKAPTIREPSEIEKRTAYLKHVETVKECRIKLFMEAYPDATPEEVDSYLDKFKEII